VIGGPLGSGASSTLAPYQFRPEDYSTTAVPIAGVLSDVVTTSGSAAITSASGGFANLRTGMSAAVCCGSAAGVSQFVTLTAVSATQATMSATASASVTCLAVYGWDATSGYRAAQAAAHTYAGQNGAAQLLHAGHYLMASAPLVGATYQGNSYAPLPLVATSARKHVVKYCQPTPGEANSLLHWQQLWPQIAGAGLVCANGAGTNNATYGPTSLIGGPVNGYGGSGSTLFTNLHVILDGISAVVPYNGKAAGFDLIGVGAATVRNCGAFGMAILPSGGGAPVPTLANPAGFTNFGYPGLRLPATTNNAVILLRDYAAYGVVNGIWLSEHTTGDFQVIGCYAGCVPFGFLTGGSMSNRAHIFRATIENCVIAIATVDPAGSTVRADFDHIETEDITSFLVNDATSVLQGYARVAAYAQTIGTGGLTLVRNAANFPVYDLKAVTGPATPPAVPATTVPITNAFYRDASVVITAGASTCTVTVGATALAIIPAAAVASVLVPSGRTVTLTYAAAPTWTWVLQ
jgi:hypothetical protein